MDANGTLVAGHLAIDASTPNWSPGGFRIAFTTETSVGPPASWISVVDADGGDLRNLTHEPVSGDCCPSWSPDGSQIAFEGRRDGNRDIYIMNADGSSQTNLTNNPAMDYGPDWQPLGIGGLLTPTLTPTPTPTPTPALAPTFASEPIAIPTATPVGFSLQLPQAGAEPPIASGTGLGRPTLLAGVAVMVGSVALAAAWYARRHRLGRM